MFVVGDDDGRVGPEGGIGLHGGDNGRHVLLALEEGGITGM